MDMGNQILTFATMIGVGLFLGLLFDMYRVSLGKRRQNRILIWTMDLLYWLVCVLVVFFALLFTNGGELRFYIFIGLVSGALFYYRLLSRYVIAFLMKVLVFFAACIRLIKQVVCFVFLKPARFMGRMMAIPVYFTGNTALRLYRHWIVPPEKK